MCTGQLTEMTGNEGREMMKDDTRKKTNIVFRIGALNHQGAQILIFLYKQVGTPCET